MQKKPSIVQKSPPHSSLFALNKPLLLYMYIYAYYYPTTQGSGSLLVVKAYYAYYPPKPPEVAPGRGVREGLGDKVVDKVVALRDT